MHCENTNNQRAAYATHPEFSRGRRYAEDEHLYRNIYQRDRDRIIHSSAFRRLEHKTQVFIFREGDYRKRLTHTLEVAQIARTIARSLGLNEDLTEAIALAHDVGHTPFGHAGEDVLKKLLQDQGGFNHNLQGLRIVDFLEKKYPNFPGLNLTWEVREGIAKHSTRYDNQAMLQDFPELNLKEMPTLETQVVDIADEIAYDNHDLDDGIRTGLIHENKLDQVEFWHRTKELLKNKYPTADKEILHYIIIRTLINEQVTNLIENTKKLILDNAITSWEKAKLHPSRLVDFSDPIKRIRAPLKQFLWDNLYLHWKVLRMTEKAKTILEYLFRSYFENPNMLPPDFQERIDKQDSKKKVIADYIASMTDRQAQDEYKKFFDPYEKI